MIKTFGTSSLTYDIEALADVFEKAIAPTQDLVNKACDPVLEKPVQVVNDHGRLIEAPLDERIRWYNDVIERLVKVRIIAPWCNNLKLSRREERAVCGTGSRDEGAAESDPWGPSHVLGREAFQHRDAGMLNALGGVFWKEFTGPSLIKSPPDGAGLPRDVDFCQRDGCDHSSHSKRSRDDTSMRQQKPRSKARFFPWRLRGAAYFHGTSINKLDEMRFTHREQTKRIV
jgi:hypothetical protein